MHVFAILKFDHANCITLEIKFHTKQDVSTCHYRKKSYCQKCEMYRGYICNVYTILEPLMNAKDPYFGLITPFGQW